MFVKFREDCDGVESDKEEEQIGNGRWKAPVIPHFRKYEQIRPRMWPVVCIFDESQTLLRVASLASL